MADVITLLGDETFVKPDDPIPRDGWGRPKIIPEGGGKPIPYRRCTSYVDVLENRYNLEQHMKRQVAIGVSKSPDLALSVVAAVGDKTELDKQTKTTLNKLAASAEEVAGSHFKSRRGTAYHSLTEMVDKGEDLAHVPEDVKRDLRAYWSATRGFEVKGIERFVVNDDLKVGGTFDRMLFRGGEHFIGDIKTGNVEFGAGKIAMQLAIYAHGVLYEHDGPTRTALPDNLNKEWGVVIHLPAGEGVCTLKWVNIGKAWTKYIQPLLPGVWEYRSDKDWYLPFEDGK